MGDEVRGKYHGKNFHLLDKVESKIYHELVSEVEKLLDSHAELKTMTNKFLEAPDNITKSKLVFKRETSYEKQIREMLALSNNPEYGQYVIPFFSVDPRRADTPEKAVAYLNDIKKNVGKDKSFAGIKLYCPLGYSPTDPFLYGSKDGDGTEDCLYKFCQDNKIPITAHCSDAGFATFARYAKVSGYIFSNESTAKEKVVYVENKMIDFGTTVLGAKDKKEAIRKRARLLNHPQIWTKVYERYNDIYLNLAHFGGEDIVGDWRPIMYDIIKVYPNAYTDFSCYSDATRLKKVKEEYYDPKSAPKDKFLYGSDFYLVMLSETHFSSYTKAFNNIFSEQEFDDISINTPRAFMQYVFSG
jgi:predicted TIM-barrel fold metal-dependent hydrolase